MSTASIAQPMNWAAAYRDHARAHPGAALGLTVAGVAVLALFALSLAHIFSGAAWAPVRFGLTGGLACFAATAAGAMPALFLRSIPQRVEDSMLGFAAGMMLAASSFSLIIPGLEAGESVAGGKFGGAALVVVGMALGVLLMRGLDEFVPHEHESAGLCGPGRERINRIWLLVLAIALHNLPEGMAVGVGFAQNDLKVGVPLTTAIAIQDVPEGLAVALALRGAKVAPVPAMLIAAATGLIEPVGAILGVGLAVGLPFVYPVGLGLAAGAMIFVVSHEVIPETHRNGHQTPATIGLMAGFALMMVLDTTLG
jgi:ZIP family zinc transporter